MRKTNYNSKSSNELGDEVKQNKNDLNALVIPKQDNKTEI